MAKEQAIKTKLSFDGEKEYKAACKDINNSLKVLSSELKVVAAEYGANDKSIESLTAKQDILKRQYDEQAKKIKETEKVLEDLKKEANQNVDAIARFEVALNNSRAAMAKTSRELNEIEKALDEAATASVDFSDEMGEAGNAAEKSGGKFSALGGVIGGVATGFATGMATIGASVVAGLGYATSVADDVQGAMNDFEAATGIAEAGAKGFEDTMLNIYNGNYGENMEDIAASMATVAQSAKDTDPTNIEKLTTNALALRDTFGYDIQEQMRAVNMLMDQFGITGDEAFNLIAQGTQNGLNKNGDFLDSINEYSVHFKNLGLDAEDMFNSMANGAESGTFSVDKLGDAVKEFGIRVKDESDATNAAFATIGVDADKTAAAFAQGGAAASEALSEVTNKLFEMEDPLAQNQAGVALFGTMWEDLGTEGIKALSNMNGEISTTTDAMAAINAVKYDTVGEAFTGLGRVLQTELVLPIGKELTPIIGEFANTMTTAAKNANGDIALMADAFGKGISDMVQGLSEQLPAFADFATTIVISLVDGIAQSLPAIGAAATSIIIVLVEGLVDMLPTIIDGALQIILELGKGISEALPTLIPKVVEVITYLVQAIVNNLPMIVQVALDIITSLAFGLLEAIPTLLASVPTIITALVEAVLGAIPQIIQAGIELITALIGALPQIITTIVQAIPQIIDGIITAVLEAIPLIIQAGIDLLIALIGALPQIITTIVQAIPQIISGIVEALIGNIDKIILAGVQLFVSLIANLPTIIVEIVKAVPQIIGGIVTAIGDLGWMLVEAGGNLIKGLWDGIVGAGAWLWEQVSGFFGGLVDDVKGLLGIHSPSTVFAEIGENMADGVGVGFGDNMDGVGTDMENSIAATSGASAKAAIDALNEGLTSHADLLGGSVQVIVEMIGTGLTAANASFVQQGIDIDRNLAAGMVDGTPHLTQAVPQLITSLLNAYIAEYPKLVQQGIDINKKIAEGIANSITEITQKIPLIVTQITTAFTSYNASFVAIGENMMRGIGEGVTNMSGWLNELVNSHISSMIRSVENKLDTNSPSKVFAGIGGYMAEGLGVGFAKEMQGVEKSIRKAIPTDFDIDTGGGKKPKKPKGSTPIQITQNIYTPQYDYVKQQREAAKQFKLIARQV